MIKVEGIHLTWIVVKDLKAAVSFYTEQLGLKLKEYHEDFGWAEVVGESGCILGLAEEHAREKMRAGSNGVLTMTVQNVVATRAACLQRGITLLGEILEVPGHVKLQTAQDRDGNTFQFVEQLTGE